MASILASGYREGKRARREVGEGGEGTEGRREREEERDKSSEKDCWSMQFGMCGKTERMEDEIGVHAHINRLQSCVLSDTADLQEGTWRVH